VKSRLERGRSLLRRRLEKRGVRLPAAFLVLGLTGERVRASLRAKALQSVLGSPSPAIAALLPASVPSLASKLTWTALTVFAAGVLGLGAFQVTQGRTAGVSQQVEAETSRPTPAVRQPAAEIPRTPRDRFGDPLPAGAVRRFGTLRFRHDEIVELAFTPDRKHLIAGTGRNPLAVFDATTGRKLRSVGKSSPNNYTGFALSPDGKRVACCGFDVFVWNLETGRLIRELGCGRCQSVAISPDGEKVAAVKEFRAEVVLAEAATGKHLAEWTVKKGRVNQFNMGQYDLQALAFSPDGQFLAGILSEVVEARPFQFEAVSSQVWLLDAAKGTRVRTFGSADVPVRSFAFQPGTGRLATLGKDGIVRFWDVATGKEVQRFPAAKKGSDNYPGVLRFSADGRRCAAAAYGANVLTVLDAKDGRELRRLEIGETPSSIAIALSPDGRAVASAKLAESCVRVWDVETDTERLADAGHRAAATLSLSADGHTLISKGEDGRVIHWNLPSGHAEVRPADTREEIGRLVWSRDWSQWTLRGPRWRLKYKAQTAMLEVRSLDDSKLLREMKWPDSMGVGVTLSPDGAYLAYSINDLQNGNPVLLWNPEREKAPAPRGLLGHFGLCNTLLFTHDSKRLIVGVSPNNPNHVETIWIWDAATAKVIRKLPTLTAPGPMILTADDRLLITSDAGRVWNLETGEEAARLLKTKGMIGNLFLSPDERFLTGATSEGLNVWETASWKPIRLFPAAPSPHSMVFSRDGRSLFVANRVSTILEWDLLGRSANGRRPPAGEVPNPDRLNELWRTLAQTPDKAYPTVWEMLDHPAESVRFLKGKLSPVKPVDAKRVRQLLDRLDAESFAQREEASRQLLALGEPVLPALRQALKEKPSLERKGRIERIVAALAGTPAPEQLRFLRGLAVLEWSGLAEAEEHLRRLAEGDPSASLTRAAQAALRRMAR
jgi:WD40 repeat protein